jgi:hypothetical protein
MGGQDFNSDGAVEPGIACTVNLAHAARTYGRLDFIGTESRTRDERHGRAPERLFQWR